MAPLSHFELYGLEMLEADLEVLALFEKIDQKLFFWSFEQMAPLSRFELSGPEMLEADPEVLALFEKIDLKLFFWGFSGYNEEVTR